MPESKIQIVNQNDEIVGNKDRDKIDFEKYHPKDFSELIKNFS